MFGVLLLPYFSNDKKEASELFSEPYLFCFPHQSKTKVGQDASARLIHDDESVEAFMETHFHEGVQVETVQVVR